MYAARSRARNYNIRIAFCTLNMVGPGRSGHRHRSPRQWSQVFAFRPLSLSVSLSLSPIPSAASLVRRPLRSLSSLSFFVSSAIYSLSTPHCRSRTQLTSPCSPKEPSLTSSSSHVSWRSPRRVPFAAAPALHGLSPPPPPPRKRP